MSATTFAPRPEPLRRVSAPAAPRPYLRLVSPDEARHRRLTRLLTGTLVFATFATLFATVALRVLLAQGQVDIDRLSASVQARQAAGAGLRLQVTELEAPGQIVAAARRRLGMVTPGAVTYLTPAPPATGGAPLR